MTGMYWRQKDFRAAQEREAIRLALSPWFDTVLLDLNPR